MTNIDPEGLAPAAEVVAAEDVGEHDDQQPYPDEEQEEPQHGSSVKIASSTGASSKTLRSQTIRHADLF